MSKRLSPNHCPAAAIRGLAFAITCLLFSGFAVAQTFPLPNRIELNIARNSLLGGAADVDLSLIAENPTRSYDSFHFLITYDAAYVTYVSAAPGPLLTNCGWDSFTATQETFAGGVTAVRLVAAAENASCFLQGIQQGVLATLRFDVLNIPSHECQYSMLNFYWNDCTDNLLSSALDDSVFVSYNVCAPTQFTCTLSGPGGVPNVIGTPSWCTTGLVGGERPSRTLTFFDGGIDIICSDSTDQSGDINLNGIAYEIADYVIFVNYFFTGMAAFNPNPSFRLAQIAASDVNQDGRNLTFQDLIYLYRVIIGDALPFPKRPAPRLASAFFNVNDSTKSVSAAYTGDLAGGWFVFDGEIQPTFYPPQNETWSTDVITSGGRTRILIEPKQRGSHPNSVWFTFTGTGILDSVETGDWDDNEIAAAITQNSFYGFCGDSDGDGMNSISDAVYLVRFIFVAGPPPLDNRVSDIDCNGVTNISDVVYLLQFIFGGGPAPCLNCP